MRALLIYFWKKIIEENQLPGMKALPAALFSIERPKAFDALMLDFIARFI
jgi:hypothetical protein